MAQKVIVELVDDLDGTASDDITTVSFGLDGVSYEIDLNDDNASKLRDAFADVVASGRRVGGRMKRGITPAGAAARPVVDREQTKAVREWARQNDYELADRGRIPASVIEAFEEAHATASKPKAKRGKKAA